MPGEMHKVMGALAWRSLSEADQEAWGLSAEVPEWAPSFFQSFQPRSVEEKIAVYSLFLDQLGYEMSFARQFPQYLLPGGTLVPHGAAGPGLSHAALDEQLFEVWGWRHVLRSFVPRMIEEARQGRKEEAALTGGVLAHFLQDGACLSHLVSARLLYDLSPNDPEVGHVDLHSPFDDCNPPLGTVTPLLLGTTPGEVVLRLSHLGELNYREALHRTIPLLQACRAGDRETMDSLSQPLLQSAVLQLASLLHTVIVLAEDRVPEEEAAALGAWDLVEAVPYLVHAGFDYRAVVPKNHNLVGGRYVPLRADLGEGVTTVTPGLGMTSFHSVRYLLEPGVFDRVEGQVALSADYTRDQEEDMEVEFFISLAEDWNQTITSDLEYGDALPKVYSCWLKPGQVAHTFSVELGQAQTLCLAVRPRVVRRTDGYKCWYPHVVLAHPRLTKR